MQEKRTVHINGDEWHYKVGSTNVSIRKPDGTRFIVGLNRIFKQSIDSTKWGDFKVKPSIVKAFIEKEVLGKPLEVPEGFTRGELLDFLSKMTHHWADEQGKYKSEWSERDWQKYLDIRDIILKHGVK